MLKEVFGAEQPKINKKLNPSQIIGGIVPHAGYRYSANEAVHFFHFLKNTHQKFDTFIIINPCHHGSMKDICLDSHNSWQTPLGEAPLDTELMENALSAFYGMRKLDAIEKKPATRELINWIRALRSDPDFKPTQLADGDLPYLGVLFKKSQDFERAAETIHQKNLFQQ